MLPTDSCSVNQSTSRLLASSSAFLLPLEFLRVVGCGLDSTGSVYDPVVRILNVVFHLRVPYKARNVLTSLGSFNRPRAQLFGVSK